MNLASFEKYFDFEPGSRIGIAKSNIDIPFMDGVTPGLSVATFMKGEAIEIYYDTNIWPGFIRWRSADAKTTVCMGIETGCKVSGIEYIPRSQRGTDAGADSRSESDPQPYQEHWFDRLLRDLRPKAVLVDKSKKEVDSDNNRVLDGSSPGLHPGGFRFDTLSQRVGKTEVGSKVKTYYHNR